MEDDERNTSPNAPGTPSKPDILGLATLLGLVLLGVACWWLVPWFMHVVKHQDCIGSGAMDC